MRVQLYYYGVTTNILVKFSRVMVLLVYYSVFLNPQMKNLPPPPHTPPMTYNVILYSRVVQPFATAACVCISRRATAAAAADARSRNTALLLISLGRQLKLPGHPHRYFVRHTMLLRTRDKRLRRRRACSAFVGPKSRTPYLGTSATRANVIFADGCVRT